MKNNILLLLVFMLVSCVPVSKAPATALVQTLDVNSATKQNTSPTNNVSANANLEMIGRVLIYTSDSVYIANSDGGTPVLIHAVDSPLTMLSLSPDGTKFAYFQGNYLYIQDVKTGDIKPLNQKIIGSIGGELRWSHDGTKIVLSCSTVDEPASSGSICLVDVDSGQIEILIHEMDLMSVHSPYSSYFIELEDWSRDDSKIIFTYFSPSEKGQKQDFEIYIYDTSSKTIRKILDGKKQDVITQFGSAAISPDNKTLLISGSDINSSPQLFQVDLENNILSQLTKSATYSFSNPVWGSDNSYFYAYARQNTPTTKVGTAILNINGNILSFLNINGVVVEWVK
jgi:Tol biopolymer transport system component